MEKTIEEMIAVMIAYKEGKQIETCYNHNNHPRRWELIVTTPTWNWNDYDYRVKPEPTFIPYNTPEEFLDGQRMHGLSVTNKKSHWEGVPHVNSACGLSIVMSDGGRGTSCFDDLFNRFTWQDGTPCGKIEEK